MILSKRAADTLASCNALVILPRNAVLPNLQNIQLFEMRFQTLAIRQTRRLMLITLLISQRSRVMTRVKRWSERSWLLDLLARGENALRQGRSCAVVYLGLTHTRRPLFLWSHSCKRRAWLMSILTREFIVRSPSVSGSDEQRSQRLRRPRTTKKRNVGALSVCCNPELHG